MSIKPQWAQGFGPSEATRGSWTPLDMSTITEYPSSGRGKFAMLTYQVGSETTSPSAASFIDTAIANTTYIASTIYYGGSATVLIPPTNLKYLEIYNNSSNNCYLLPLSTTYSVCSAQGMIISQYAFYSISRTIPAITIALEVGKSADLRIIGHYVS